jgi:hypothetical protein
MKNGRPSWYKGRRYTCAISGEDVYELSGDFRKQRGMVVHKRHYDSLTDQERAEQLKSVIQGGR